MTDADDLPCQELVELVTDYLKNQLPVGARLRFEAHLKYGSAPNGIDRARGA